MGLQKNFKLTEVSFFIKVMLSLHFCPPFRNNQDQERHRICGQSLPVELQLSTKEKVCLFFFSFQYNLKKANPRCGQKLNSDAFIFCYSSGVI